MGVFELRRMIPSRQHGPLPMRDTQAREVSRNGVCGYSGIPVAVDHQRGHSQTGWVYGVEVLFLNPVHTYRIGRYGLRRKRLHHHSRGDGWRNEIAEGIGARRLRTFRHTRSRETRVLQVWIFYEPEEHEG